MISSARTWPVFLAALFLFLLTGCPQEDGCSDQYEANDTCLQAFDLGVVGEDEAEKSWTATVCEEADEDWFTFKAEEGSKSCIPFDSQSFELRVSLEPPSADCIDLNLYLYDESCALLESSELPGCLEEEIIVSWGGTCGPDDSLTFVVQVRGADISQVSEEAYTLTIDMAEL